MKQYIHVGNIGVSEAQAHENTLRLIQLEDNQVFAARAANPLPRYEPVRLSWSAAAAYVFGRGIEVVNLANPFRA